MDGKTFSVESGMIFTIDPSLTGFAVCAWKRGEDAPRLMQRFVSEPLGGTVACRIIRYRKLISRVLECLHPLGMPDVILLEGYSFGSKGSAVITMGEFGGLLRESLFDHYMDSIKEVSPTTLKQFATGSGKGNKDLVMAHVAKRWGVIYQTSDEADAYVLARIGMVALGWVPADNQAQQTAADVAMHGKPKKVRPPKRKAS